MAGFLPDEQRGLRPLFAAIVQRAIHDARGQVFYVEPAHRAVVQREAYDWLHSDTATLLALFTGISANRYRAILRLLPAPPEQIAA